MTRKFCNSVKRILEQSIKGNITVHIKHNTLICDIEIEHMVYRYTNDTILPVIQYSIAVTEEIKFEYSRMIREKFFK